MNVNEVWAMHAQLENIDESYLEELSQGMIWHDWDYNCHYSDFIRISQAVGKYQVIRHYDVECCKHWSAIDLQCPEEWPEWVGSIDIDDFEENDFEDEDGDGNMTTYRDVMYDEAEVLGEYMQEWLDCTTGDIVVLGRPYAEDRSYLDPEADWELIEEGDEFCCLRYHKGVRSRHVDLSVNEELLKAGYKPMQIIPWEDLNYTEDEEEQAFYDLDRPVCDYMADIITDIRCRKANDLMGMSFYNLLKRSDVALKIVCRYNYSINRMSSYLHYLDNLIYLDKDLHNPHYVCPKDFKSMYESIGKQATNRRERIMRQRALEQKRIALYESEHAEEIFQELRGPYLGIAFDNGRYFVHVLQTKEEYWEEGEAMHHCVGKGGFWKNPTSICVGIRDKNGHREATAEIGLVSFKVCQCYTYCDEIHEDNEELLSLLMSNMWRFKQASGLRTIGQESVLRTAI